MSHRMVFVEPTGRRWSRIARWGTGTAGILLLVFTFAVALVISPLHMSTQQSRMPDLTVKDTTRQAPVVGKGPLERVVEVQRDAANWNYVEPYTRQVLGVVPAEERKKIGERKYAIQHYGYSAAAKKTLSLTYDDGPNPVVTHRLLDLLASYKAPSTFFVTGLSVAAAPSIARRMVNEGHAVGIHTVTHPHLPSKPAWRAQLEITTMDRMLRDITGHGSTMWRMPYTSPEEDSAPDNIGGILHAQRLGYVHASYDFDSLDWSYYGREGFRADEIPLPDFSSGENITVLMHDAGGPGREHVVEYTKRLLDAAKLNGYTFHTMPQVNPDIATANAPSERSPIDKIATAGVITFASSPSWLMAGLFIFAVVTMMVLGFLYAILAIIRYLHRRSIIWPDADRVHLDVSVILSAYNEEDVIERTIRSIFASHYRLHEVIVVNDGSKDQTWEVLSRLDDEFPALRIINQENAGKSAALNNAISLATGSIIVTLDADTVLAVDAISNLVRHFARDTSMKIGGVAGVIAVGNPDVSLITRWQALEYISQIGLERAAHDTLRGITIIPGACAAWRACALREAGGYSTDTLAEDCDLALTVQKNGWRVTQDDRAIAYTEVPETLDDLLKQRNRWTFGTIQAMWKHRNLMGSRTLPGIGWFTMPMYWLSIAVPVLFLPFATWSAIQTLDQQGPWLLLLFFAAFTIVHALLVSLSIALMRGNMKLVLFVPVYRIMFEFLRAYLLYNALFCAIAGRKVGWNKLARSGRLDAAQTAKVGA